MKIKPANKSYLRLPDHIMSTYEQARAVIIPFGIEASVSYGGGTSKGPYAIIKASGELEFFDEEFWLEPYEEIGIVTIEEGDINPHLGKALSQLEGLVSKVLDDGKFPMVFGGEHSLTAGAIRPFLKQHDDLVILQFDAHADLRDGYLGEHYSHAAAMRRCLDDDRVELVSVGIRNISKEEIPFLEENKDRIHIYWAKDKKNWNVKEIVSHLKSRPVYLTFDVDGFDSSLMPATGTPEPGGLFWHDVMEVISEASKVCRIVGADINELAPIKNFEACDFLVAKLAYKILAYALIGTRKEV